MKTINFNNQILDSVKKLQLDRGLSENDLRVTAHDFATNVMNSEKQSLFKLRYDKFSTQMNTRRNSKDKSKVNPFKTQRQSWISPLEQRKIQEQ